MAGQESERQGAEVLRDYLEEIGLRDVQLNAFEIDCWWRDSSSLETDGPHDRSYGKDYQIIALPGTPASTGEGELVDVGCGRPENFEESDCEGVVVMASRSTWVNTTWSR